MTIQPTMLKGARAPAEERIADLFSEATAGLPGSSVPSVGAWRTANMEAFFALGLPSRRIEAWKYTDLRARMPRLHALAGLLPSRAQVDLEDAIGIALARLDCYRAVFVDGQFREELSTVGNVPGVEFDTLRAAFGDERSAAPVVEKLAPKRGDTIAQLAAAFATDGALISIAPNAKLGKPLHLVFIGGKTAPRLASLQNAVWVGEGAQVTLIETHFGGTDAQTFIASRIGLAARAAVRHVRFTAGSALHLASTAVELASQSDYLSLQLALGGGLTRAETEIRFVGERARCHYAGAMLLRDASHTDFTLAVEHAAPACESRELAKAVLDGRGHGVFQGKVIVQRAAQKTDGKQMARALLLSDEAEFDAKPELEIYADDVVCGHGATAGQLDEELMFYLKARGIPEAQARALLVSAFVGEVLDKIEDEGLRGALQEKVDDWLSA